MKSKVDEISGDRDNFELDVQGVGDWPPYDTCKLVDRVCWTPKGWVLEEYKRWHKFAGSVARKRGWDTTLRCEIFQKFLHSLLIMELAGRGVHRCRLVITEVPRDAEPLLAPLEDMLRRIWRSGWRPGGVRVEVELLGVCRDGP